MSWEREKLLEALKLVMPAVSKNEDHQGQDSVVFADSWVRAFNGELSISFPFESGIQCSVRGPELFKVVSKIKAKTMEVSLEDGILHIKGGKTSLKLKTMEDDSAIQESLGSLDLDNADFQPVPEDMMEGISLCSHSMCSNPAFAFLAGMRFTNNEILTSDNHRVGAYYMDQEGLEYDFSLPRGGVLGLLKTGIKPINLAVSDSWAHFQDQEGVIYSSKMLQEKFPDDKVRALLPSEEEIKEMGEFHKFPEGMEESLDRVSILASKDDDQETHYVSIYAEGAGIIIKGSQSIGEIMDVLPCEEGMMPEGKVLNIAPELLTTILRATREFSLGENKVYFDTGKFKSILACFLEE